MNKSFLIKNFLEERNKKIEKRKNSINKTPAMKKDVVDVYENMRIHGHKTFVKKTELNSFLDNEVKKTVSDLIDSDVRKQIEIAKTNLKQEIEKGNGKIKDLSDSIKSINKNIELVDDIKSSELNRLENELFTHKEIVGNLMQSLSNIKTLLDGEVVLNNSNVVSIKNILESLKKYVKTGDLFNLFEMRAGKNIEILEFEENGKRVYKISSKGGGGVAILKGGQYQPLENQRLSTTNDVEFNSVTIPNEPVNPYDATNKEYVDNAVANLGAMFYFTDTASGISTYKVANLTDGGVETSVNKTNVVDNEILQGWILSAADTPDILSLGEYENHITVEKTSGTADLQVYFELYEYKTDTSEVLIGTSSQSTLITTKAEFRLSLNLLNNYTMTTGSRLLYKVRATVGLTGSAPHLSVYYQGVSPSHLNLPTSLFFLQDYFINKTGDTMEGDLSFAGYKAIAMACDSGATLPTTPTEGQWFLHTPTGRNILMLYVGGAWSAMYSFGVATVYVDITNGTDSSDKGFGTGTDAYQTITFAVDALPKNGTAGTEAFINIASGTYTDVPDIASFTYRINFVGSAMSADYTGTLTSVTAGSGTTRASFSDSTAVWTTNEWQDYFVSANMFQFTDEPMAMPIYQNTGTALTLSAPLSSQLSTPLVGDTYTIGRPTVIWNPTNQISVGQYQIVEFTFINFTGGTTNRYFLGGANSVATFESCLMDMDGDFWQSTRFMNFTFYSCIFLPASGRNIVQTTHSTTINLSRCLLASKSGTTPIFFLTSGSVLTLGAGNTIYGTALVYTINAGSTVSHASTSALGYVFYEDITTVFSVGTGGVVLTGSGFLTFTDVNQKYSDAWSLGKTTFTNTRKEDRDVLLVVGGRAEIQEVVGQNGQIGELVSDVRGNGKNISDVVHLLNGFKAPTNPKIGDVYIDNN